MSLLVGPLQELLRVLVMAFHVSTDFHSVVSASVKSISDLVGLKKRVSYVRILRRM